MAGRPDSRARGNHWERFARFELEKAGLKHVTSNFHIRGGEIDLVMNDGGTLVFVEVRQRTSGSRGTAVESVGPGKVARIRRAASVWLVQQRLQNPNCRFDLFCIDGDGPRPRSTWIKSAF